MPGRNEIINRLLRATLLTFIASLIFWAFFQISKTPDLAAVNPFAEDPVDAIGSIAVQVAFAVSLLTLARAVQMSRAQTAPANKSRLIVRGNSVALLAIAVTLGADGLMELRHPTWNESIWGLLLFAGLVTVALITCAAALITVGAARRSKAERTTEQPSVDAAGSLGEALDDLWSLVRVILSWFAQSLPWLGRPLRWIDSLGTRLFEWMINWPYIGPRSHPWRFCAAVALAAGVALAVAHGLEEGPPGNLVLAVTVSSIFIGVEFVAVLAGYLALGGFLGLRPPLRLHR
jgi:hypothetical protein